MPNLMVGFLNDITKVSSTARDIADIASTAIEVRSTVMGGVKTTRDIIRYFKTGEMMRSVTNWFNQKESFGENSSFAEDDDDFDAGFNASKDEDDKHTKALDSKEMRDIGVGQTREMYRVANQTYNAHLHTTAEILNSIDQRSAEVLSSLKTTQTTLQRMVKIADRIAGLEESKLAKRDRMGSIFDAAGNITLRTIFDIVIHQFTSSRQSLLKTVIDKSGLGELDKKAHSWITNVQNTLLSRMINLPFFKKLFGDRSRMPARKDYSAYIEGQYTRQPAIFDGMVRKTIVDIIPGYLKAITQSLTGTAYHISGYGTLTTEKPIDDFNLTIDTTFHTDLNRRHSESIAQSVGSDDVDTAEISTLQSVLVSQYIYYIYKNGIRVLNERELTNGGIRSIHTHVANIFSNHTKHKYSYWLKLISFIEARLIADKTYRQSFVRSVNSGFHRLNEAAKQVVNERAVQNTQFTREAFDKHAADLIGYDNRFAEFEGKTPFELIRQGLITEDELPEKYRKNLFKKIDSLVDFHNEVRKSGYDSAGNLLSDTLLRKYSLLNSIFERLNKGINVYVVPPNYTETPEIAININAMAIPYPTSTSKVTVDVTLPDPQKPGDKPETPSDKLVNSAKKLANTVKSKGAGLFNPIKSAVMNEWSKMKSDATMIRDQAVDSIGDSFDRTLLNDDIRRLSESDKDQDGKDVTTIKAVMAGLQTSAEDGDVKGDIGSLRDMASEIEDPEAKKRIESIIQRTSESVGKPKKAKSFLGKAFLLVFGAFKTATKKVTSTLGSLLGKYVKWVTKMFKSAGKNIISGAKSIKEGFVGTKDGEQKGIIRDSIAWGKKKISDIKNSQAVQNIRDTGGYLADTAKTLVGMGKQKASDFWNSTSVKNLREAGGYAVDTVKTLGGLAADKAKDAASKVADKVKPYAEKAGKGAINIAGKIGGVALIAKDKVASSSFGKGFASVFEDEKPEITSTSLFDKRAADISDIVKESPTGSLFATLVSAVKKYTESMVDFVDMITDSDADNAKENVKKKQQERAEAEKKKKEEEEKKKKEEEERKKKEAEEAAAKKASAKSPIGFDLGKIAGGMTKILQGIMKSVSTIVKSMTGLMAILELGDQILKKALKPLNKVFFQIYNLLKPIVRLVTKILKAVAEAIVKIVDSLIKVLQPILEAVEPIISSLLETLMPILEMVTDLVNILIVPMTALIKVTLIPLLQHIGNSLQIMLGIVQVGFGIILTALGGWLAATGMILKFITAGFAGDSMKETGTQLFNMGKQMVTSGAQSVVKGIKSELVMIKDTALNAITFGQANAGLDDDDEDESKSTRSKNTKLRGSALEGTYGSGDEDALYSLGDGLKDAIKTMKGTGQKFLTAFTPEDDDEDFTNGAFKELQKLANKVVNVFTGEDDDTVSEKLDKASKAESSEQLKYTAADLTDEEKAQIEAKAFENFQKDFPQRSTETNEEYKKRYESYKQKYVDAATAEYLKEKQNKALNGEDGGAMSIINSTSGDDGMISSFQSGMESVDNSVQSGQFGEMVSEWAANREDGESGGTRRKKRRSGSNQDYIEFTGELSQGNIWDHHKNKSGVDKFMKTAFSAGLTGAQVATITSTGIWEDGGEKLWGSKSLTATTYDVHGQRAQGIMNWVDKNVDYGDTVEEQLQYIQRTYFSSSTNDSRAKVHKNSYWDQDEAGYKKATGRSGFKLQDGERYGPPMESDLVEGSEHFFRTALVPECIHTAEGPRKYIGTAAGVYNWLIDQGYIDVGDYDEEYYEDDDEEGTTSRRKKGSGKDRVLRAASELFLAAKEAQDRDHGPYGHGAYIKNIKFDDGQTIDMMSAMCTGTQAAIVKRMGYYLPAASGKSYTSTYQGDYAMGWANGTPSGWGVNNSDGHPNIYEKNGKKSKDWIVTNDGSYQAGDITLPGTAWGDKSQTMWHAHMAAFQYGGRWYGFNGGDPKNNPESVKGQNIAKFYLSHGRMPRDGDDIDISKYNSSGYLQNYGGKTGVVIRYVGGSDDDDYEEPTTTRKKKKTTKLTGSSTEEKVYKYLTSKGMSGIGAAGMMGCFKYESNFQSNNLENSYQAKWGYPAGDAGDKQYTSDVDSKRESEKQFVTSRGTGTCGYGIPQFTSSNLKQDLYNRTVKKGKSISDTSSQLDSILYHIKKNSKVNGTTLFDKIKRASSPTEANKWFLWRYEAGTSYNSDAAVAKAYPWMGMTGVNNRHTAAEQYYDMFGSGMDDEDYMTYDDDVIEDPSYVESIQDELMSPSDQQDYIYDGLDDADIELPVGDDVLIPTLLDNNFGTDNNFQIPALPSNLTSQPQSSALIINRFSASGFDLSEYIDEVLVNDYNVEAPRINELVNEIFEELPEYLEDDDDDDFTEEDDLFIQQLASAFL